MLNGQEDQEARMERLRILGVALPLAYVAAIVGFLAFNPFPSWASSLVAVLVSAPLVAAFAAFVFSVVETMRGQLMRREERFRGLVDSAPDGIVISDAGGTIVMVNRQTEEMFGYASGELTGMHIDALIPRELHPRHADHRRRYYESPSVRPMGAGLELVALRRDETRMPVEISLSPIEQEEGKLVIAVVRDISDRRRLEEERERLLAETETQRERERIAMDLHDGIIQSIYAVSLGLEAVMTDVEEHPADARRSIDRAMTQLEEVIQDTRSYIFSLRPPRIDDDIAQSLSTLADDFRVNSLIETSLWIDARMPPIDTGRSLAMFHVAQEALNNARKHGRPTSVGIRVECCDGRLVMEVRDNGAGFDTARETPATHRGLRNMAARAEAAGGTLAIESAPGEGTKIRFELPLRRTDRHEGDMR